MNSTLSAYRVLYVGFSGGLDSTVLLHQLIQQPALKSKVTAVHINHGLSSFADKWEDHCRTLCEHWSIPFMVEKLNLSREGNLEERARVARLGVFKSLLKKNDCLLLAHHQLDQAETLLLNLMRGSGIQGMSAMPYQKPLGLGTLIRPFLQKSRDDLHHYAISNHLTWVEDDSNQSLNFSRNYIRHEVIPLLKARWPAAIANLSKAAHHCQMAYHAENLLAYQDYPDLKVPSVELKFSPLVHLPVERIGAILRLWLSQNQLGSPSNKLIQKIIQEMMFAKRDSNPQIEIQGKWIRRFRDALYLEDKPLNSLHQTLVWKAFPDPLKWGNGVIEAYFSEDGLPIPDGADICVKARSGGERIHFNGQTKSLKKLFQSWKIPPWQRNVIPLIYINDSLKAVVGYTVDKTSATNLNKKYQIVFKMKD